MSLAERLAKPPVNARNQFCTVGLLLQATYGGPKGEWEALAGALSTPGWTAVQIETALAEEGHSVSLRHIRDHRRGHGEAECVAHTVGVLRPIGRPDDTR